MNHFVFVVCGSREHIDSLNFSLMHLKKFSAASIHVITDVTRNEGEISHDSIIDVKTPEKLNHHEASIYLKTSLHRYLDMNKNDEYCYLDSDVVAVSSDTDKIFKEVAEPVRFAQDHDSLGSFSPYAMNCGCLEQHENKRKEISETLKKLDSNYDHFNTDRQKEEIRFHDFFQELKASPLKNAHRIIAYLSLKYIIPVKRFKLTSNFTFDKKNSSWKNKAGKTITFDFPRLYKNREDLHSILNKQGITGLDSVLKCDHLRAYLKTEYKLDIPNSWRHWNGGVFRFNASSVDFLETWHRLTVEEFKNPKTKTRDQAMLAVTAWKFGLQSMKCLPVKYNFITEFNNSDVAWNKEKGYTYNAYKSLFNPVFLHIYHHWGDENWSIWQSVTQKH